MDDKQNTLYHRFNSVKKAVWASARPIDKALEIIENLLKEHQRQQTIMRAAYAELEEAHRTPRATQLKRALTGDDPHAIYPNMLTPAAREEFVEGARNNIFSQDTPEPPSTPPMLARFVFQKEQADNDKT